MLSARKHGWLRSFYEITLRELFSAKAATLKLLKGWEKIKSIDDRYAFIAGALNLRKPFHT
jgi:hypothetical protein